MLYIIQNDPDVPPGIVGEELKLLGVDSTLAHPYLGEALPDPAQVSAAIVLGGAMGANDDASYPFLTGLKDFIRDVVKRQVPYLGICLGGQLLAAAMGAEVASNTSQELGTYSVMLTEEGSEDRLFRNIPEAFITFQWHNDSFAIPQKGVRLACSPSCHNQAFRVGPCAWGLQFHPEVDAGIVENWSSWTVETSSRTGEIIAAYREWESDYRAAARILVGNFVAVARLKDRII